MIRGQHEPQNEDTKQESSRVSQRLQKKRALGFLIREPLWNRGFPLPVPPLPLIPLKKKGGRRHPPASGLVKAVITRFSMRKPKVLEKPKSQVEPPPTSPGQRGETPAARSGCHFWVQFGKSHLLQPKLKSKDPTTSGM